MGKDDKVVNVTKSRQIEQQQKMVKVTIAQIQAIADQYDSCPVECDGMTNILHYYLAEANIPHAVYFGSIRDLQENTNMTPHNWIKIDGQEGWITVDYRAKMWLGDHDYIPHGVFLASNYSNIQYDGVSMYLPLLPKGVIDILASDV